MNKLLDKNRDRILFFEVWVLGFLYVFPIILANRYYCDDTQRVLYHNAGWALDGRPLTELMLNILCGGQRYVFDIFPLPLILAVTIFSVVSLMWSQKFYKVDGKITVIASFLPIAFPFFLTNLSYRFDCLSITVSLALLMLPFLVDTDTLVKRLVLDVLFILASMCFYQASVGMFIGLVLFVFFLELADDRPNIKTLGIHAAAVVISTVLYKIVIASVFVDKQGWRAEANGFMSSSNPVMQVIRNLEDVVRLLADYIRGAGARQLLLYMAVWGFGAVSLYLNTKDDGIRSRIIRILCYCLLTPVMFVASEMPMLVLTTSYADTWHQPELVVMMFVLSLAIVLIAKRYPRIALVAGVLVALCHFSFSYAYGNVLRAQKEYEEYIVHSIVSDIETSGTEPDEIEVFGEIPFSPMAKNMSELMPILNNMIPAGIDDDGMYNGAIINHYSQKHLAFADKTEEDRAYVAENEPTLKRTVYDIYFHENRVYVDFRNGD